ncbi:hypothetical protein Tco_1233549 [Tanacetum coccineum]
MSRSSLSKQNMAFVSSSNNNTSGTNKAVNIAHGVSTASTQVNAANFTNIDNLSDDVICVFFASQPNSPQLVHEELARGFLKKTGRKLTVNETSTSTTLVSCDGLGEYDWSDQAEEGPYYALMAFSSLSSDSEVLDDEEEDVSQPKIENKTVRPSIVKKESVKSKQQEKTARKTDKQVEQHRQNTHSPRGNQRN